ncbi:hypothetical protein RFG91_004793 [Klebsiella aerogenes]|nr:hypothetical protein [Klebsiella aerogenes]
MSQIIRNVIIPSVSGAAPKRLQHLFPFRPGNTPIHDVMRNLIKKISIRQ